MPLGSPCCLAVFCTARGALVLCWRFALYKCFIIIIIIQSECEKEMCSLGEDLVCVYARSAPKGRVFDCVVFEERELFVCDA